MEIIRLDSTVDVRCSCCSRRTGRRVYLTADVSGLEILCPACLTFLYGDMLLRSGEAWEESEVLWRHVDMPGDKNE